MPVQPLLRWDQVYQLPWRQLEVRCLSPGLRRRRHPLRRHWWGEKPMVLLLHPGKLVACPPFPVAVSPKHEANCCFSPSAPWCLTPASATMESTGARTQTPATTACPARHASPAHSPSAGAWSRPPPTSRYVGQAAGQHNGGCPRREQPGKGGMSLRHLHKKPRVDAQSSF